MEYWPAARLQPYAGNPRKNDAAVDRMVEAIRQFGFAVPLLAVGATGELIDGHLRLKAGVKIGMTEYPVIPCDNWTPEQIKAFRLLANRSVNWASWDVELLRTEFASLSASGFQLGLTGFDSIEISGFLAPAANPREDETPPAPDVASTRTGDLWILGNHRLLCGDSTVQPDVVRALGFVKPAVMVTDPPYGVDYDPVWRLKAGVNKPWQKRAEGTVRNDDRSDWRQAWSLFPGSVAYVWHGALHAAGVAQSLEAAGFSIHSQIIWAKSSLVMGRGHYHWQHEPCWYAWRNKGDWKGDRKQSTLWQIQNMHATQGDVDDGKTNHSTQKPVECMRRPIVNSSSPGQAVYDPFVGSGTTIIAAETQGRHCIALELDPVYCDMAVLRWQKFTGKAAVLEGDGRTFDQIKAERLIIEAVPA
jgi:DNA modification methylase